MRPRSEKPPASPASGTPAFTFPRPLPTPTRNAIGSSHLVTARVRAARDTRMPASTTRSRSPTASATFTPTRQRNVTSRFESLKNAREFFQWLMPDANAAASHSRFQNHRDWLSPVIVSTASAEPAFHSASAPFIPPTPSPFRDLRKSSPAMGPAAGRSTAIFVPTAGQRSIGEPTSCRQ
jgi:hypothetical protein